MLLHFPEMLVLRQTKNVTGGVGLGATLDTEQPVQGVEIVAEQPSLCFFLILQNIRDGMIDETVLKLLCGPRWMAQRFGTLLVHHLY